MMHGTMNVKCINSGFCANVNVTSEVQSRSVDLSELTLPSFTDSSKQVPLFFIPDLDLYFKLKQKTDHLRLPLTFRAVEESIAKQWFSSIHESLIAMMSLGKGLQICYGIPFVRQALLGARSI